MRILNTLLISLVAFVFNVASAWAGENWSHSTALTDEYPQGQYDTAHDSATSRNAGAQIDEVSPPDCDPFLDLWAVADDEPLSKRQVLGLICHARAQIDEATSPPDCDPFGLRDLWAVADDEPLSKRQVESLICNARRAKATKESQITEEIPRSTGAASSQRPGALEGVSIVTLASGTIEVLSPGTAHLLLGRIGFAPGARLPFDSTDPSVDLVYMSAGTLTFRIEAPMTVARAVGPGTPVPTEPEAIHAGTEFKMSTGDSALFPPNAAGEVWNDSDENATAWVTNVALFTTAASTTTP